MAAAKKGGLGKGIDSLIPNKVSKPTETVSAETGAKNEKVVEGVLVSINKVEPNREQPRKNFDEDALLELSESIKQFAAACCVGIRHVSHNDIHAALSVIGRNRTTKEDQLVIRMR